MLLATLALPMLLSSSTADLSGNIRARVAAAPGAVQAFIARRADCNHFTGEEPYDQARAAELDRTIRDLRCARIDRDEARLRERFKRDVAVLRLLDETADDPGL